MLGFIIAIQGFYLLSQLRARVRVESLSSDRRKLSRLPRSRTLMQRTRFGTAAGVGMVARSYIPKREPTFKYQSHLFFLCGFFRASQQEATHMMALVVNGRHRLPV